MKKVLQVDQADNSHDTAEAAVVESLGRALGWPGVSIGADGAEDQQVEAVEGT